MAGIHVVPKSRTDPWVWVLVVLAIVAVLLLIGLAARADASMMVQQFHEQAVL